MRVLWLSITPSLFDESKLGGWVASLEDAIRKYAMGVELAIAFEHSSTMFKLEKSGVSYYPINIQKSKLDRIKLKFSSNYEWKLIRPRILSVIADFNPDIIQCFGSEWPYALIKKDVEVPVVIHMQGFTNIYNLSVAMSCRTIDYFKFSHYNPFSLLRILFGRFKTNQDNKRERDIMRLNKYFMGRTLWDQNIVKYFGSNAKYFLCSEVLRKEIVNFPQKWKFIHRTKMRIITISSASVVKGNSLILRTAKILKDFGFSFEWRVAGSLSSFQLFERTLGLKHEDLNIKLLGLIEAQDVAKELTEAEVYVHSAIIDNSPNSLCEAQLLGCPVLSTYVGGIPQLVSDGKTGFLYPYNEPYALAFLLMNVHNNENLLSMLSKNEISIASIRHDGKRIVNGLIKIYETIINEKNN